MRTLCLWLGVFALADAGSVSLETILDTARNQHPALQAMRYADQSQASLAVAENSRQPLYMSLEGSRAVPDGADAGNEFSIGLEREWMLPGAYGDAQRSARYAHEARTLESRRRALEWTYGIEAAYHDACLEAEGFSAYERNYEAFRSLYIKKEKAYELGELSKKELLQLRMELQQMQRRLEAYRNGTRRTLTELATLAAQPELAEATLTCSDMAPLGQGVEANAERPFALSYDAVDKRIQSAAATSRRYDTVIDSVDLSVRYDRELDTDRYAVGVRIPLGFGSSAKEAYRAAALHEVSALEYERANLKTEKEGRLSALTSQLREHADTAAVLEETVQTYRDELMPLVEKSYALGESAAVEYLMGLRGLWQWQSDLIATKQAYYRTLFERNTLLEIEESR